MKPIFILLGITGLLYSQSMNCKTVGWKRIDSCTVEIYQECDEWQGPAGPIVEKAFVVTLKSSTPILQDGDPDEVEIEPEVHAPKKIKWDQKKAKTLKIK